MTIIYKECRVLFGENGQFRVLQDGQQIGGDMRRKERIVRNRALPKWVLKALDSGKWVEVKEFVPKGDNANNFYLEVRGETITPTIKKEEKVESYKISDEYWYSAKVEARYQRSRKVYKDFEEPMYSYDGWKKVDEKIIKGCSKEKWNNFVDNNPLPAREEQYYEDVVGTDTEYKVLNDNTCDEITYDILQPHTLGKYYTYKLVDYIPTIEENKMADCWSTKRKEVSRVNLKIVKKEKVSEKIEKRESAPYESNDGYRMCTDITEYNVTTYYVVLENGVELIHTDYKYLKTY